MNKALQENLIKLRKSNELTQKDLAEKINYSDKVISKWERGESVPTIEALSILADFYNMAVDELIGKKEVTKPLDEIKQLEVIKTKGPSIYRVLFIVPFIALVIIALFSQNTDIIGPSITVFGIAIIWYSVIISVCTFESVYKGKKIRLENKGFEEMIYVDDKLLHIVKSGFKVNPVITVELDDDVLIFEMNNITSIKCKLFVTSKEFHTEKEKNKPNKGKLNTKNIVIIVSVNIVIAVVFGLVRRFLGDIEALILLLGLGSVLVTYLVHYYKKHGNLFIDKKTK